MKNLFITFLLLFITLNGFSLTDTSFKPYGKPIIQVFGNFDYNATKDAQKKYSFWFGRAHFGYQQQFTKQISAKIIIDMGRPTTVGTIAFTDSAGHLLNTTNNSKEGSYYTMTLKFASLEWKPNKIITMQAGAILQNHYMTQEKFWGYRYLAETFQDRYYKIPSSDLGFITYIKPYEKFGFDFALTNGEGFRFDQDAYGDVKIASGIDFNPIKGLQTRVFYDYTKSKNPLKPAEQQLFSAFAGYKFKEKFRIGAEYNYRKNHLNIANQDLFGYSIYGSYIISKRIEYFARFDQLMSNKKNNAIQVWNYNADGKAIITGLQYSPISDLNFSLNYQGFMPKNNDFNFQHHILFSFAYKL